ncbi:MAG: polysaccharide deacetylase family protein [Nitrosarchaeum sp.]|nr:polysaccharide deacetylase family protein [Nitrosarchaeum sp.]
MKLVHAGIISTGLVITIGVSLVAPALIIPHLPQNYPVFLSFEINNSYNLPSWCQDLSDTITRFDVKATVFISGKLAEQHPECVTLFGDDVEIGSMTYHYVSLSSSDYLLQLDEVQQGKQTIDIIGNFDSKSFKAPFSQTDDNIYSLLSRSGILADFSYEDHFNIYENGQFVRYDLVTVDHPSEIPSSEGLMPSRFSFDNSQSIDVISGIIYEIKSYNTQFLTVSDLVANPVLGDY